MCCLTVARKIVKVDIKTPGSLPPKGRGKEKTSDIRRRLFREIEYLSF